MGTIEPMLVHRTALAMGVIPDLSNSDLVLQGDQRSVVLDHHGCTFLACFD